MKLSVIVPIYKVEKYLRKCVDSILNQDLAPEEYEIILVDDGSPDNCGAIADEYAAKYCNIRVIHQENGGLSMARNAGLAAANGEYIQFVDSDDFLEPNVLGALVCKMDSDGLDVLRFDYQNVNEDYEVFQPYKDVKPFVDLRDSICDGETFLNERLGYACYAVQFIIKRDLLIENNLFFKPGIYFEDTEWTPRMLLASGRVTSTTTIAYNYLLRNGSITGQRSLESSRKLSQDLITVFNGYIELAKSANDPRWFLGHIADDLPGMLTSLALLDERSIAKRYTKQIKPFLPLKSFHNTARTIRKIKIINFSPHLFIFFVRIKSFYSKLIDFFAADKWDLGIVETRLEDITTGQAIRVHKVKHKYRGHWFADPFILDVSDSTISILVEDYEYSRGIGVISKLVIDMSRNIVLQRDVILQKDTHLSFPFILRQNSDIYVFPENSRSGAFFSYRFNPETGKLSDERTVLNKPLTDAVVVKFDSRDYLFSTSMPNPNGSMLQIWSHDNDTDSFIPKESVLFTSNIARNAGAFFSVNGHWYRPAQDCNNSYGESIVIQEVTASDSGFEFMDVRKITVPSKLLYTGIHTLNSYEGVTITDLHSYRFPIIGRLIAAIVTIKKRI